MVTETRRFYNPIQRDAATFLKTASETNGDYTLVEVELAPHGGNDLHYHTDFTEEFEVLEGQLNVHCGAKELVLKPGEKALVERFVNHRFYSTSDEPARFLVTLRPGHAGFEKTIQIAYGLASDGKTTPDGTPKGPLTLGLIFQLSGTRLPGFFKVIEPFFGVLASLAR
ncbi:MAG: cupin domain-containing protein, partial [Anaerolineae bacterium]|nr:cupin domain-containing protein [Anaerolineae bacterium]